MAEETVQSQEGVNNGAADDASNSMEFSAISIPQTVKNLHSKAVSALERQNIDIAIDLFFKCIQQCPPYIAARRNLRLAEILRYKARKGTGAFNHHLSSVTNVFNVIKIKKLVKSEKFDEAIIETERLLMADPLNLSFVKLFSEVAAANKSYYEAGVMTLETVKDHLPANNSEIVEIMGRFYFSVKNYNKAREYLERIYLKRPNDDEIAKMLKDSEALGTLEQGWISADTGGDYRAALANTEEAVRLEQQSKMVKSDDDTEAIIRETLEKIEKEPNNINYYLSLSGLYAQQKSYDEALGVIENARKMVSADPELDRRYSNITVEKYDAEIVKLRDAGEVDAANEKEAERNQYVFDDIADRVTRYPNDQHLRYELGIQYYTYEHYDEAIQQLQIAQKNPKDRVSALYYLALCFRHKGLLDMAVAQLEQALEYLPTMNAEKMDVFYLMGEICEEEGRLDDAAKYFKEIYRVDVTYRDVSKRVEAIYARQKNNK